MLKALMGLLVILTVTSCSDVQCGGAPQSASDTGASNTQTVSSDGALFAIAGSAAMTGICDSLN